MQEALGVDVAMSLDECVPAAAPPARGRAGGARARPRGRRAGSRPVGGADMALFGIVQGGLDPALRARERRARCSRSASTATRSAVCRWASRREETARVAAETVALLPADAAALPDGRRDAAGSASLRGHGV